MLIMLLQNTEEDRKKKKKRNMCLIRFYRNVCLARWTRVRAHVCVFLKFVYETIVLNLFVYKALFFRVVLFFFFSSLLRSMYFNKVASLARLYDVRRITGFFNCFFFVFLLFSFFFLFWNLSVRFFFSSYAHSLTVILLLNNFYLLNICARPKWKSLEKKTSNINKSNEGKLQNSQTV